MRYLALVTLAIPIALSVAILAPRPGHLVQLPSGVVDVRAEMAVDEGTELVGAPSGTVLRVAPGFTGRAVIVVRGNGVRLRDFTVDGNREAIEVRAGLPPYDRPFARFTSGNGVLADGVEGLDVERVQF